MLQILQKTNAFYLISDVISHFSGKIYGEQGDLVYVVADYINVVIVENKTSFRFACQKENISSTPVAPAKKVNSIINTKTRRK